MGIVRLIGTRILPSFAVVVGADLATKALAESILTLHWPRPIIGEWFQLKLVFNEGIAFGLFATTGPGVAIVSGFATLLLAVWLLYSLWKGNDLLLSPWAMGVLLGGAVGNLFDRWVDGRVTDFLDFGISTHRFATFNLADVFIMVGVGLILLRTYKRRPVEEIGDENPTSSDKHEERT